MRRAPFAPALLAAALAALAALAPGSARAQDLAIFDTHMHFSAGAWDVLTPAQVIALMDRAGVAGALVSSTPDDGTLKLLDHAPGRIVGGFRPYTDAHGLGAWNGSDAALEYSRRRLDAGRHRVFGEIHLALPVTLETPQMAAYMRLVLEHGLYFHVHSDATVVNALFAKWPKLRTLWAHAGMSDSAETVGRTLDRHPALWAELSYRAHDIMPGADLDPAWRAVLVRHADRFLIGTDTWATERWNEYEGLIGEHRAWLAELPADVAAKIANGNARRLFGPGGQGGQGGQGG